MTDTPPSQPQPPTRARILLDLFALVMLVAGLAAVVYGAFLVAPAAGWITAGSVVVASAALIGMGRDEE